MPRPCRHFSRPRARSIWSCRYEGDPGDSGSGGDEVEELRHPWLAVEQRLVDVDIEDIRPLSTCWRAIAQRGVPVAGLDGLGNFGDPVMLVRSPMTKKARRRCVASWKAERLKRKGGMDRRSAVSMQNCRSELARESECKNRLQAGSYTD